MQCDIENATIYYEQYGDGTPIVMLHGGHVDHQQMMTDMEPLFEGREGWKRIYLDLPGHGRTKISSSITDNDQVLEIIRSFIDEILPSQSFCVAGISTGGYLARGIAYKRPASLLGLLLIAPARYASAPAESVPPLVTLVRNEAVASTVTPEEALVFQKLVVQSQSALDRLRSVFLPAIRLADEEFRARNLDSYEFSFDVDEPPEPFQKPTLIVTGRQDSVVGYRDAWEMLEHFPRATFAVLDKTGHLLTVEQGELFRTLATEWLHRVKEYPQEAT